MLKVDHYTSLAHAVARLDRDSYELRGAIYDRALMDLAKSLYSAAPPLSKADIDMEFLAFREAVRRVEFGDLDDLNWLAQRSAPAAPQVPQDSPYAGSAIPPDHYRDPSMNRRARIIARGTRSVVGRVAGRTILAMAFIGLSIAGYFYATGQFDLAPLARLLDRVAAMEWLGGRAELPAQASERAVYHEQGGSLAGSQQFAGKAFWRTRSEPGGRGEQPELVLTLDLQVPERGFSLAMSMRRDASDGTVMSHLIEFKFTGSNGFPLDAIARVMGLSLKSVEDKSGAALTGQSVKVAPGLFLFGLSADKDELRRNIELLRTQAQLDIPIAFTDGRTGAIAVEKGASGERAFDEAFNQWTP